MSMSLSPSDAELRIFISYSHANEKDLARLKRHLDGMKDAAPVDVWTDARIGVGQNWRQEIDTALSEAAVAVLLTHLIRNGSFSRLTSVA
jgi:hypothetical protein